MNRKPGLRCGACHQECAVTIDEMPLDWCLRPGAKLDFRLPADGHPVEVQRLDGPEWKD